MSKTFYDKKSGKYLSFRYSVFSQTNSYGDKEFCVYDERQEIRDGLAYETRAEANAEAKRLEKICGVLCPATKATVTS